MPDIRLNLRLPPELYAAIKLQADREERSLNRQVIYLLRLALRENPNPANSDDSGDS